METWARHSPALAIQTCERRIKLTNCAPFTTTVLWILPEIEGVIRAGNQRTLYMLSTNVLWIYQFFWPKIKGTVTCERLLVWWESSQMPQGLVKPRTGWKSQFVVCGKWLWRSSLRALRGVLMTQSIHMIPRVQDQGLPQMLSLYLIFSS